MLRVAGVFTYDSTAEVVGEDGKYRYFRPIREAMFRAVRSEVDRHHPQTTLYLCMENREVWEGAGMIERIPRGLVRYLDERAEAILGCCC